VISESKWAIVGKVLGPLAAIATVVGCVIAVIGYINSPSSWLVATIHPMAFRLPTTAHQLVEVMKTDHPVSASAGDYLMRVSRATSLVKINLYNDGDLPISDIHIAVDGAVLMQKEQRGQMTRRSYLRINPERPLRVCYSEHVIAGPPVRPSGIPVHT
jgi:hypothetical protein